MRQKLGEPKVAVEGLVRLISNLWGLDWTVGNFDL